MTENILLESDAPLTDAEKRLFAYFGEGAKIRPPYRILNPQHIVVGDRVAIRENAFISAFTDLRSLLDYVDPHYKGDLDPAAYLYTPRLEIGRECQLGRLLTISCTNSITIERNVLFSERVFVGDNNHAFSHADVPIMQQHNKSGPPVVIGQGSWVAIGSIILPGVRLGRQTVVGANSVVRGGEYPSHAVIGPRPAEVFYTRHDLKD